MIILSSYFLDFIKVYQAEQQSPFIISVLGISTQVSLPVFSFTINQNDAVEPFLDQGSSGTMNTNHI